VTQQTGLEALSTESRRFEPPAELAASANVTAEAYERAAQDRLGFWAEQAGRLQWDTPWDEVLDWQPPFAKWFVGGKLNVAVNCVDRHVDAGNGDRVALHWVGEPEDDTRDITYAELSARSAWPPTRSSSSASARRPRLHLPADGAGGGHLDAGLRPHRRAHTVVFGGFSAQALVDRITAAEAKVVITADGGYRRGRPSALKPAVDEALERCPSVTNVLVVKRTKQDVDWVEGRDLWWSDAVDSQPEEHDAQAFDAEQPLFLLYTSGSTGKPKGILHTSGGYLTRPRGRTGRCSTSSPRPTSTGAPPTSAG
jgi:acetyl-CoA synthetase